MSDEEEPIEEEPIEEEPIEEEPTEEIFGGDEEGGFDAGEEGGDEEGGGGNPFAGCCVGLVLFPLALALLGWNEVNSVCTGKSIQFAMDNVQPVSSCALPPPAGSIMYFSCPVNQAQLPTWSEADFDVTNILPNVTWQALGARKQVQFFGCDETRSSNRRRQTGFTYRYSKEWMSPTSYTRPTSCSRANASTCGATACAEPSGTLGSALLQEWGGSIEAGSFSITPGLLSAALGLATTAEGTGYDEASCQSNPAVGCERVQYSGQNANYLSFFGVAADATGGLTEMTVPGSWGCEAGTYAQLIGSDATMSPEEAGQLLLDTNNLVAWLLRGLGVFLAVLGIYLCLSPIAAAADVMGDCLSNIPCLGGCLADSIEGVVGTVLWGISCGVGCSFSLLVIAIFQLYLRPVVGGSLLAVVLCCCCGVVALRQSQGAPNKKQKNKANEDEGTQMTEGYQVPQGYQAPMQQPMMQQPVMMQQPMAQQAYSIQVPEGAEPGTVLPFMTADGRQMQAQVPFGMQPGMVFQVVA